MFWLDVRSVSLIPSARFEVADIMLRLNLTGVVGKFFIPKWAMYTDRLL